MINIDKYNFFIFDCDGVILDSNKLKSNAFVEALPNEPPDLVEEFVEYHKENGGISRYEKIRYYFEKIKKQVKAEEEIDNALKTFAEIVSKRLVKCNYVPGVKEFIEKMFNLNKRLFVVSGSDENELIQVFKKRGIDHYFEKIYGSPDNKIINTKKVFKLNGKRVNGIFFGDSEADYEAAAQYGIDFVFINGATEWFNGKKVGDIKYVYNNFKIMI